MLLVLSAFVIKRNYCISQSLIVPVFSKPGLCNTTPLFCRHTAAGCSALLGCLERLVTTFEAADELAAAYLISSAQLPAMPGVPTQSAEASTAAVSMFDDDLDTAVITAAPGATR